MFSVDAAFASLVENAVERVLERHLHSLSQAVSANSNAAAPEKYLTIAEAVKTGAACERKVREWTRTGRLRTFGGPRALRIKLSDLNALMAEEARRRTAPALVADAEDEADKIFRRKR